VVAMQGIERQLRRPKKNGGNVKTSGTRGAFSIKVAPLWTRPSDKFFNVHHAL
jgi:hypothetical protein